jgi:hypothetical protein
LPQQVDLQQMGRTAQYFALLGAVQAPSSAARQLIGRAKHFDGGYDLALVGDRHDLHETFLDLLGTYLDLPVWVTCQGDRCCVRAATSGRFSRLLLYPDIRVNLAVWFDDIEPLLYPGDVPRRQQRVQRRAEERDEDVMESSPPHRIFQVGIHSRKGAGHD